MAAISTHQSSRFAGANRAALIVVGILSLLGLAYAIMRVDILRARIVDLRTDLARAREELTSTTAQLHALQASQSQESTQLQQVQENVNHLSSGLNRQITQATQQWTRSEVLYLTRLAKDQLLHAHDVGGARSTLEAALARSLAQPGVIGDEVQQQLQAALASLNALPANQELDIEQRLQQAEQQVASLPLAATPARTAAIIDADGAWQRFWLRLRAAAAQLLVVRRSGEQSSLLVSDQHGFLQRQYLVQQLLTARLAAARHDQRAYQQSIETGVRWLDQAFDTGHADTKALRSHLLALQPLSVEPALPDLGPSIAALESAFGKGATP